MRGGMNPPGAVLRFGDALAEKEFSEGGLPEQRLLNGLGRLLRHLPEADYRLYTEIL